MTDTTVRYLLVELNFDGATDPDEVTDQPGTVGFVAEGIGQYLDGEPGLVEVSDVRQVYPGDTVSPDSTPYHDEAMSLYAPEALAKVITEAKGALDSLADEHEGGFRDHVESLAALSDRLRHLVRNM